jgi:hypothetical protein
LMPASLAGSSRWFTDCRLTGRRFCCSLDKRALEAKARHPMTLKGRGEVLLHRATSLTLRVSK